MVDEPKSWVNDGHKIDLMLDSDQVFPKVVCPYEDGEKHGDKTAMCRNEGKGPCLVKEAIHDIGFEANCTGLTILCRDQIPIEYGWMGPDEFWFKVCGYPTSGEVIRQRKELALVLLGDEARHLQVPEYIVEQMSFQSWFDLDEETKANIKEDWARHQENKEKKRDKPAAKERAKKALAPVGKPKHKVEPQPKIDMRDDDDEDPNDDGVAKDDEGNPIDPMLVQYEALPDFIKGADGNKSHVAGVGEGGEAVEMAEDAMDPKPGETDAMSMTADD